MEGNKPKQQRERPVDKQNPIKLNEMPGGKKPEVIKIDEKELGEEFMVPDYRSKSLFTKKQISKTKKRKLNKIARKSRKINQRWAKK